MCTHPILIMQMMWYICGFWVGRPIWYTSGFQLGEDNVRRAIFTTKNPHGAHMGPICVGTCGFWMGRPIWYTSVFYMGHVGSVYLWVPGGKAHLIYIWFSAGWRQSSTCNYHHQKPTWGPYGAYMCWYLWVLDGKAHLVYIWFLNGPRGLRIPVGSLWEGPSDIHLVFSWVKTIFDVRLSPPKTHMGPMWGPYVLVLVGSWWKAHLVYIWFLAGPSRCSTCDFHKQKPTWGPHGAHMCGLWVGRPIWYTSGFCMGHVGFSQPIQNPDGPQIFCYLCSSLRCPISVLSAFWSHWTGEWSRPTRTLLPFAALFAADPCFSWFRPGSMPSWRIISGVGLLSWRGFLSQFLSRKKNSF